MPLIELKWRFLSVCRSVGRSVVRRSGDGEDDDDGERDLCVCVCLNDEQKFLKNNYLIKWRRVVENDYDCPEWIDLRGDRRPATGELWTATTTDGANVWQM